MTTIAPHYGSRLQMMNRLGMNEWYGFRFRWKMSVQDTVDDVDFGCITDLALGPFLFIWYHPAKFYRSFPI